MSHPDSTQEEPQEARGAPGSRDKGDGVDGGSADRPAGSSNAEDHTGVDAQETVDDDSPTLLAGGG